MSMRRSLKEGEGERTVEDTGDLSEEGSDPLGTLWDLDVQEFLDGKRVAEFIRHYSEN